MIVWLIILAAAVMLGLAVFLTYVLGWANQALHVEVDPKIEAVDAALPGANCGGCGYVGCSEYAEAVIKEGAAPDLCPVGGAGVAAEVAEIAGVEMDESHPMRAVVYCAACNTEKLGRHEYTGEQTCAAASLVAGVQGCAYGCLGLGDCIAACNFDAMHLIDGRLEVDYEKCVGCKACVKACPRDVIGMIPMIAEDMYVVACANQDKTKDVKSVCTIGCIGCSLCEKKSGGWVKMDGNLAKLDYENYDTQTIDEQMKTAFEKCPAKGMIKKVGKGGTQGFEM